MLNHQIRCINWPLILISLSHHENRKQPTSLRNRHATHIFGSDGFENLHFVLNKAAEISIFFFLWLLQVSYTASRFISSADSGINETRRLAAFFGTCCLNLLYLSGLSFRDTQGVWVFRVWVFETPRGSEFLGSEVWVFEVWVWDTLCILDQFN